MDRLDLLLVNPGTSQAVYQGLSESLTAIEPPLWCRLIAGYCRDRGQAVEIMDLEAGRVEPWPVKPPRFIAVVLHGHQPSASTQQMTGIGRLLEEIRRVYPYAKTILVGGHVAALTQRTMEEEACDYACSGEGPETICGLLKGAPLDELPGLAYREGGEIRINPRGTPIADLDTYLHGNTWDLLPMESYRAHNWQCFDGSPRGPYASIYTSLGCPFACTFCCINAPFGGKGYRTRSPASVVAEVARLYRRYGVKTLKIVDEMFVLKPSHYVPICEGLAALPFASELNIWAYARIDTVKPEKLALLRRAGIRWLALGIESASSVVRDGAEKHLDDAAIRRIVKQIQDAGINVIGNFIFGLPDDTLEGMHETLDLAMSLDLDFANFYSAMAYPGSALYEATPAEDLPANWSGYSQHSRDTRPLPTATMGSSEVLAFRDAAFRRYFESAAYRDHIGRKFGPEALAEIDTMLAQPMEREMRYDRRRA